MYSVYKKNKSPKILVLLFIILFVISFDVISLTEILSHSFFLTDFNDSYEAFFHSLLLTIFISPFIYCFMFKPLLKALDNLNDLSGMDHLTGVFNRGRFMILAEQQIKYSLRTKQPLELFFVDIDNLKPINDQLGHKNGDAAIKGTATILKTIFRDSDIVARIGGDEFLILSLGNSITLSQIKKRINTQISTMNLKFDLSMSIGSAIFNPKKPCSIEELISRADEEMYKNKKSKKLEDLKI